MKTQIGPEIYFKKTYDSKKRFCSYWHQIDEIMDLNHRRVLEIGVGSGFTARYLKAKGVSVVTIDIEKVLRPDITADIIHLPFKDSSFDIVACFELLEHLPYEDFTRCLSEISRVTNRRAVLSLPDAGRIFRYLFELPFTVNAIKGIITMPRLKKLVHQFDGYHYWEIAKAGYPLKRIMKDIDGAGFRIEKNYRVFENPGHRFFVLRKRHERSNS